VVPITKGPKPPVLVEKAEEWTAEYVRYVAGESVPLAAQTRYRHPEIKAAVKAETWSKCVYCESRVSHVSPGDVEHIIPKSVRPELVVEWLNLTHACTVCNRQKGDVYDPDLPFLNPYLDDPEMFLSFCGPWVCHQSGATRGYVTRRRLSLNRPDLLQKRVELLESLQTLLDRHDSEADVAVRAYLLDQLLEYAAASGEFAATARSFLRSKGLWSSP
jgi:hypothetical protein